MPAPHEHFERLNATLLPQLPALVKQWLPAGRASGMEWTALNPRRHDRRPGSFRVNLRSRQAKAAAILSRSTLTCSPEDGRAPPRGR